MMDSSNKRKQARSGAERIKKFRERKRAENLQGYLEDERKRISELRRKKKENMTNSDKEAQKKYERDRKRLQRAKAKMSSTSSTGTPCSSLGTPYSCKQTYSKAIIKTFKALPKSPRKQAAVVTGLAKRVGLDLITRMEDNIRSGPSEEETLVRNFYYRPDIVYTCPGMKDVITVWKEGKKEKLQKHYLTMFLHEAFFIFKEENPSVKIGLSKFSSLRPGNVLLLKETPSEQCKCKIHENFILKLKGLKISYDNDFWTMRLCDDSLNSLCWINECEDCNNGKQMMVPADLTAKVTWKEWIKSDDLRIKLVEKEDETGVLFNELMKDLPKMMSHVNLKRVQQKEFELEKNDTSKRILQIDFAMSFSIEYQNEIQSALWSRTSVLLFTAAVFWKNKCSTYLICSDTKNKDKDTIFVFLDLLFTEVLRKGPDINEEVIWSDGPSSEFKNRFIVKALEILSKKHERNITWNYFATSHGKGVVDGVGDNMKRLVRAKMMSQGEGCTIQCAKDFAEAATLLDTKTKIFYVGQDHISDTIDSGKPWENVPPVPGITSFHQISYKDGFIFARTNALSPEMSIGAKETSLNSALDSADLKQGTWVIVNYEGTHYPGEIVNVVSESVFEVSVMVPTTAPKHFKWPRPLDCISYDRNEIVKTILPPVAVNNRGLFKIDDL